jgi:hypothetical protein
MDLTEIATKIIKGVLKLTPGQSVTISAEIHNVYDNNDPLVEIPFLEELALQVRKYKGLPTIDISTENMHKRFFDEITDDSQSISLDLFNKYLNTSDIFIDLSWRSNPLFYKSIPESSFKKHNILPKIFIKKFEEKNKKLILLGFPTKGMAKYFDIDHDTLKKTYFSALNIDYFNLKKRCLILDNKLLKSRKWQIATENRTLDINLIADRKCYYGEFNKELIMTLPTGMWQQEISIETLNGIIYCNQVYSDQYIWKNVQIIFENGRVTDVETNFQQSNMSVLRENLAGKIEKILVSIGLNDAVNRKSFYSLFDMAKNGSLSLVINTPNTTVIALSDTASLSCNDDENVLRDLYNE